MSDKTIETTRQIGPKQAISALEHCIALKRPVMIWGAPGIGKSDIVKKIGDEQTREVIDIRLPLWEPTDIKGIPFYNSKSNAMEWAPPIELPSDPKSTAILFLDEISPLTKPSDAALLNSVSLDAML